jgi:ABC-type sugar transport system ATPase subunit
LLRARSGESQLRFGLVVCHPRDQAFHETRGELNSIAIEADHLFAVLQDARQRGVTLLYVSHRMPEVFRLCDWITVLRDGIAVRTCPASELNEPGLIRLMVGRDLSVPISSHNPVAGPVVLSLDNVGCSESGLRNISFDLHAGQILGLAGLVGSGRTTLARAIKAGRLSATRNETGGYSIDAAEPRPAPAPIMLDRAPWFPSAAHAPS